MDEKTRDAAYAAANLSTLKHNIETYISYAKGLVTDVEGTDAYLYDKLNQANQGLDCLIDYIEEIIKINNK